MSQEKEWPDAERRSSISVIDHLSQQIHVLHDGISEIKATMRELASAITKLALIEERQSVTAQSMERLFTAEGALEKRVVELEKSGILNAQVTKWIMGAVGMAIGGAVMYFLKGH